MGLARDLTMGQPRKRGQHTWTQGQWARLRTVLRQTTPDASELRVLLTTLGAQPGRQRYAEGAMLLDGWELYRTLTGSTEGPRRGKY
jgi:hypothetical protein